MGIKEKKSNKKNIKRKYGGKNMNAIAVANTPKKKDYLQVLEPTARHKRVTKKESTETNLSVYEKAFIELDDDEIDTLIKLMDSND